MQDDVAGVRGQGAMSPEQEEALCHARVLREMLQDKRRELEELEQRWIEANRKARGPWNETTQKEFDVEGFCKDSDPPPAEQEKSNERADG